MPAQPISAEQRGRLLAMPERRGYVREVTGDDMRLIADARAEQSRRLASRARGKAYSGRGLAIARATLRGESERLAVLALEPGRDGQRPRSNLKRICQTRVLQSLP
jgi:hypothetical protein